MAISTVQELTDAAARWVNRENDADFLADVPNMILLLEGELKRELRRRAIRTSISLTSGSVALPSAAAEVRSLRFNAGTAAQDVPLHPRSIDVINELRPLYPDTGKPVYFSVLDRTLVLLPAPNATYPAEIVYMQSYVPVATDPALIAEAPDLYLYGLLFHAMPWLEHDEREAVWETKYKAALVGLNLVREREEFAMLQRQAVRLPRVFGERP